MFVFKVPFKGSVGVYDIDVEILSEAAIALEYDHPFFILLLF